MKAARPAAVATVTLLSSMLVGCGQPGQPSTQAGAINIVPQGTERDIALACGRASVLMHLMTRGDWPPEFRYLDPRSMPGFDPAKAEHDARAAEYLGEAIEKLGVWSPQVENDPGLLDRALRENGWTIVEAGKKVAANERSWLNLQDRVGWCIAHYDVNVAARNTAPTPAAARTSMEAPQ